MSLIDELTKPSKGLSQAQILAAMVDIEYVFRSTDGETAFVTVAVDGHHETWAVRSKGFRRWLVKKFYTIEGKPPGAQAMADALGAIEAKAQFSGHVHDVHVRVAGHEKAVYVDLANTEWQSVEITASGWRLVTNPPVKLRRSRGMLPLPTPTAGGSVEDLRSFVNVTDDAQWRLLVGWLVAAIRGTGPFPVLAIGGQHGSAKTTTAKVLRSLIDPNQAMLRAEPRDVHDVMISARNGWVVALDNLSRIEPWLSDCLCRLATGGGFATRELYTDDDEIIFDAKRPVLINGIEEVVDRPDLLDRSVLLDLPVIDETRRLPEGEFWKVFDSAAPAIFGALLTAVSTGLARESSIRLPRLPRMADYAIQVTAASSALGWDDDEFLAAYAGNRASAHESVLDASPVAVAIRALVSETSPWTGTASELLAVTNTKTDEPTRRERWWPKTPKALSGALRRLAPNLRAIGVDITFDRTNRTRRVTISRTGDATVRHKRHERHDQPADYALGDAGDAKIPTLFDNGNGAEPPCRRCGREPRRPGFQWCPTCFAAASR